MSYDIRLKDRTSDETLHLDTPHQIKGDTYALGGTTECWLNVTWNYGKHFYATLGEKGIRTICGMTGADSIPLLTAAAEKLGDDIDPDYWKPTEGNAKRALLQLIAFAKMRPDGVWDGD